jgi:hypothetical protein
MVRVYDKLVKQRTFWKGELVLILRRPIVITHKTKGKFEPKWEGPYAIEQVYNGGEYQLVDPQGARPMPQSTEGFSRNIFAKICLFCCLFLFLFLTWGILRMARIHDAFSFALRGYLFSPLSNKTKWLSLTTPCW